jgi:hypothetical protein
VRAGADSDSDSDPDADPDPDADADPDTDPDSDAGIPSSSDARVPRLSRQRGEHRAYAVELLEKRVVDLRQVPKRHGHVQARPRLPRRTERVPIAFAPGPTVRPAPLLRVECDAARTTTQLPSKVPIVTFDDRYERCHCAKKR